MSQTHSPSGHRRYGIQRVCRVWEVPRSTVYAQRGQLTLPLAVAPAAKRDPRPRYSDEALAVRPARDRDLHRERR